MADSLLEHFLLRAREHPDAPVLDFEGQRFTAGALARDAAAFARALRHWGLQPGERVALFLDNSPAFVLAYLGTWWAGGVVVLVNTQYRRVELGHILADAGARVCVTSPEGAAELAPLRAGLPALEWLVTTDAFESFLTEGAAPLPLELPLPESLAVLGYTSGTTGRSKGAMLQHRHLLANVRAVTEAWRWTEGDRLLLTLPLFHTHGLMVGLHGTLYSGGTVDLRRRFVAPEVLAALCEDASLTLFFGVPTLYSRLLEEARACGARPRPLRLLRLGLGAPEPRALPRRGGGVRPAHPRALRHDRDPHEHHQPLRGRAPPRHGGHAVSRPGGARGGRAHARAPRGRRPGEIEVRGPHVFAGYWGRPDATHEAFDADGVVPHRGPRARGRGRLLPHHRPGARAHHQRRLQRLPPRGGGGARHAPRGGRGGGARPARRGPGRAGGGLHRPRAPASPPSPRPWWTSARTGSRASRSLAVWCSWTPCPATPWARCRNTCCASAGSPLSTHQHSPES